MKKYNFIGRSVRPFVGLTLLTISILAQAAPDTSTTSNVSDTYNTVVQVVSDSTITTKIKAKYAGNSLLSVFDISVETNNGVVKLSGQVDSDAQYERAIVLAQDTDGVKNVDSANLKIKSSQHPLADMIITAKVKGMLVKNNLVDDENEANPWPIHVETKNGVVYLTGKVANKAQEDKAIQTAKLVDGVKSVKANLTTK